MAEGTAQLGAGGGNVVRGHHHGHEIQQEGEQATHSAHGGTGKVGNPRSLNVVDNLSAKIVDFRHLKRGVLIDELTYLLVRARQTFEHGDHLLHEHVAEQGEQNTHHHGHTHQADHRGHAAFPAMGHQRHNQRFDGERHEQRDDDVQHQIGDVAP